MKRSKLERRTPLKRTRMRRKAPRRLSSPSADPGYLEAVRALPCRMSSLLCEGRVHAHHAVHRSQGGIDADAVPLCATHHREWHEANGAFFGWNRELRRYWAGEAITWTRAAVAAGRQGA